MSRLYYEPLPYSSPSPDRAPPLIKKEDFYDKSLRLHLVRQKCC